MMRMTIRWTSYDRIFYLLGAGIRLSILTVFGVSTILGMAMNQVTESRMALEIRTQVG
jgi:hypothetical protein